jgi:hypothetical protein
LETGVADAAEEQAEASEGAGGTGRLALGFLGAGVLGRRLVRSPRGSPAFRRRLLAPAAGGVAVVVVVVEDSITFVWYWVGFGVAGGICISVPERRSGKKRTRASLPGKIGEDGGTFVFVHW